MKTKFVSLFLLIACTGPVFGGMKSPLHLERGLSFLSEASGGSGRDGLSPKFMSNSNEIFVAKRYREPSAFANELYALTQIASLTKQSRVHSASVGKQEILMHLVPGVSLGATSEVFSANKQALLLDLSPLLAREMLLQLTLILKAGIFPVDCNSFNFLFHEKQHNRYATLIDFADALALNRNADGTFTFEASSAFSLTMPKEAFLAYGAENKKVTVTPEKALAYAAGANLMFILEGIFSLLPPEAHYQPADITALKNVQPEEATKNGALLKFIARGGIEFLNGVLAEEEKDRFTLEEALNHRFITAANLIPNEFSDGTLLFSDKFWDDFGIPNGSRSPRLEKIAARNIPSPLTLPL